MLQDPNREAFLAMLESQVLLGARFEQIARIAPSGGSGNFSLMLTAHDRTSRRRVALKVFHPERSDPYRRECFRREEVLLTRYLGQDDIIQLAAPMAAHHETVSTNTGISITFKFDYYALQLAATDLGAVLVADELDAEDKLIAFHQACRAIQRLHADRVVHRDIKPPNFLWMPDRTIRVSDLGASRDLRSSVAPLLHDYGMLWPGDLRYAPPEMLAGLFSEAPDLAVGADFFGLGATLFEMFTGVGLFGYAFGPALVADLMSVMHQVRSGRRKLAYDGFVAQLAAAHRLPDLTAINPDVPACFSDLLNELVHDLCALDYRNRLVSFPAVFRRIRACILTLRHERKLRLQADRRGQRRIARLVRVGGLRE